MVGRPFEKGKSGNPSGRPKVPQELRDLARAHTADAIKTLADVLRDKKAPPASRVSAASALLDRGYGKPVQQIDAHVDLLSRLPLSEQEALERALATLAGEPGSTEDGASTAH